MSLVPKLSEQDIRQLELPELTARILVVEDDPSVQRTLKRLLEAEGFAVDGHSDGQAGLNSFHATAPCATILDLNLPTVSGQHLCQEMKATAPSIPVIILTACCDLREKVVLLEMGADDYITKPFSPRELLARLRVALRHGNSPTRMTAVDAVFDGVVVDFCKMQVNRNGVPVALTVHEFKTLQFFVRNPGRLITRAELLEKVCGYTDDCTSRSIDNHIVKLRQKLEDDPSSPTHFRTVYGLGYRFAV